jgi:TolB-like protein/DNA-binding winged helix-turn-helix (wHTH) protein
MEIAPEEMRLVRFGPFEVNFTTGELRKHGVRLKLQDQPFQVLKMLLARPAELVTREEIRCSLWPSGTFVDFDNGLNTAINRLREALGDSAENPKFIETLPRRGYRFIGALDGVPGSRIQAGQSASPFLGAKEPVVAPKRTSLGHITEGLGAHWVRNVLFLAVGMALLLAALVGMKFGWWPRQLRRESGRIRVQSIAVLPLENLSGDPAQEYFADGMTDELTTDLAKIGNLRVISRTSATQYKGTHKRLAQIAKELNVDALVEGAVSRSADRVRITAQLIYAPTDEHLWAETYERDVHDVLTLQDEVARAIAREIRVNLTPEERGLLIARPVNPEAFEDYLRGRYYWNKWTEEAIRKGIAYFNQAIQKDTNCALAYAGLADSYNSLGDFGVAVMPPREASAQAEAAALKAVELDEQLAEAHAALAMARFRYDRNWRDVETEFKRAIELNPGYATAHHWFAHYLMAAGRLPEALAESNRAYDLNPIDPEMGVHLQWHFYYAHDYDQVIQQGRKALEIDPNLNEIHLYLGLAYEQKGMYQEAIAALQKAVDLSGRRTIALSSLGHVYGVSGEKGAALKVLKELQDSSKQRYVSSYDLAILWAGLGEKDHALAWLDRAYQETSYWLFTIETDPRLNSIRSDPRFQDLIRRVGLLPL